MHPEKEIRTLVMIKLHQTAKHFFFCQGKYFMKSSYVVDFE